MDLWDRVKQQVAEGVNTASVRSKEAIDSMKIKNQLSTLKSQKSGALEELGSIVYTLRQKAETDEPRIQAKCAAIAALDTEIRQKQEEVARVHAEAETALRKVEPAEPPQPSQPPNSVTNASPRCECGQELEAGANFCTGCGRRVERPHTDPAPPPA